MSSSLARWFRALPLALALAVPAVVWADDGGEDDAAEFDMSMAAAAFTLLSGGALILSARRKSRKSA